MRQYKTLYEVIYVYWRIYGGFSALVSSPYFHLAIVVGIVCYPIWIKDDTWAQITLGSIPNLLGFSVGAFAVILSFGQNSLSLLKDPNEAKSRYLGVVTSFVHFIIIQSLSLVVAIIGRAWPNPILGLFGTMLLIYAIAMAVAATLRLFRLARIYNQLKPEDVVAKE